MHIWSYKYRPKKLQMTIKSSCWLPYVIWLKLCMFFSTRPTHCSNGFTARCHAVTVGTNGIRVQMLGLLWDLRRFRDIRQVNLLHPGDQVQHQFLQIVIWTSMVFFCIPKLSCKFWFFKFFWEHWGLCLRPSILMANGYGKQQGLFQWLLIWYWKLSLKAFWRILGQTNYCFRSGI